MCLARDELIYDSQGKPLGSGYFGVGRGKLTEEGIEILRSVFNLPPANVLQILIEGDVSTLPYQGIWQGLLFDDTTLVF